MYNNKRNNNNILYTLYMFLDENKIKIDSRVGNSYVPKKH